MIACVTLLFACAPDVEVACYGYEGIDAVKKALRAGLAVSCEAMPIKVRIRCLLWRFIVAVFVLVNIVCNFFFLGGGWVNPLSKFTNTRISMQSNNGKRGVFFFIFYIFNRGPKRVALCADIQTEEE